MISTLRVGEVDEGSGLGLRAETGEEGGIVKYLAGELVARRMKPGMLVLLYLVSWELGNLFPLLPGVISSVRIVDSFSPCRFTWYTNVQLEEIPTSRKNS